MKVIIFFLFVATIGATGFSQCNGNEPTFNLGNDTVLCNGQSLNLTVASGFDYYSWSNGSSTNSTTVTSNGTYIVNAGIIGVSLVLNGDFQGGTSAVSNNFTSSYAPGSGGSYGLLSNPGQYAISTSPSLVHTNFSVCQDHTSGTGNMLIANGASTANTIVWSQTISVNNSTNYLFSFWQMNALNATEVSNLQLYINGSPISTIVPTSQTACFWQENSGIWNSMGATQAVLSIVNQSTLSSGNDFAIDDIYFAPICVVTDSIEVTYDTIQVNAGPDLLFCANETESIIATANVPITNYSWSSGEQGISITPSSSGIYTVTGTSANGCTASDAVNVSITPMNWDINEVLSGPTDCGLNNGYVSVITSGTFQDPPFYNWNGPGANNPNFINASVWENLPVGWYYLEIESNGCFRYDSVEIISNNPPVAAVVGNPLTGIYPLTVSFDNDSQNANTYEWDFGNGNSTNTTDLSGQIQIYDTSGVYTVMLVAINGSCTDTAYLTVIVMDPPEIPLVLPVSLETSNVFTPNSDGVNDFYEFKLENITALDLQILNRWGQIIYTSSDIHAKWNGKSMNDLDVKSGVYFYIFKAEGLQKEKFEGHGFIHLIR